MYEQGKTVLHVKLQKALLVWRKVTAVLLTLIHIVWQLNAHTNQVALMYGTWLKSNFHAKIMIKLHA
jgi:hypothetical protein